MDRPDAELIKLHAEMRGRALDRLGAPLIDALTRKTAAKDAHDAPADNRRDDR